MKVNNTFYMVYNADGSRLAYSRRTPNNGSIPFPGFFSLDPQSSFPGLNPGFEVSLTHISLSRIFHGAVTYKDGELERINLPEGYITPNGTFNAYYCDYQGNVRAVGTGGEYGTPLQIIHYYPYGLPFAEGLGASVNRYKYTGKELITEDNLNFYDFEARLQWPDLPAFNRPDPIEEDYLWLSPYTFCAANPVKYSDPSGCEIRQQDMKEWNSVKFSVKSTIELLFYLLKSILSNDEKQDREEQILNNITMINNLNSILNGMSELEKSDIVYGLNDLNKTQSNLRNKNIGQGGLSVDVKSKTIIINYVSYDNLIHEIAHANQFENGELAFMNNGNTICQDIFDELSAYRVQYSYRPTSVSTLNPQYQFGISNISDINYSWLMGVKNGKGASLYSSSLTNLSLVPINMDSGISTLMLGMPHLRQLPEPEANFSLRTIPGLFYRR